MDKKALYKALLVEDEFHSRKRLVSILKQIPEIQLLGEAENGFQGLELFQEHHPDLIFLDVEMPGMNGFEFIQQLDSVPMVIFTTAYDHFALRAFETLAVDYLLKPITLEQIQKALAKVKSLEEISQKLQPILSPVNYIGHPLAQYLRRFSIKYGNRWSLIQETQVIRFYSSESLSYLVTEDGFEHIISYSLEDLEKKLDPSFFLRIHRSSIISIPKVKDIRSLGSARFQIIMKDGTQIETSRSYCDKIKEILLDKSRKSRDDS